MSMALITEFLPNLRFDVQQRLLYGQFGILIRFAVVSLLPQTRLCIVVLALIGNGEQVGLLIVFAGRQRRRRATQAPHIQPTHQQARIDQPAEQSVDCSADVDADEVKPPRSIDPDTGLGTRLP